MLFIILQRFSIRCQTANPFGIPLVRQKIAGIEPGVVFVINRVVLNTNLIFRQISKEKFDIAFVLFKGTMQIPPGVGNICPQAGFRRIGKGVGHDGGAGCKGWVSIEYQLPKQEHLTAFCVSIKIVQGIGLLTAVHIVFSGGAVSDADPNIRILIGKRAAPRRDGISQNDDHTNGGIVSGSWGLWKLSSWGCP